MNALNTNQLIPLSSDLPILPISEREPSEDSNKNKTQEVALKIDTLVFSSLLQNNTFTFEPFIGNPELTATAIGSGFSKRMRIWISEEATEKNKTPQKTEVSFNINNVEFNCVRLIFISDLNKEGNYIMRMEDKNQENYVEKKFKAIKNNKILN